MSARNALLRHFAGEGILDTYRSGYMGLGYGHCLLRRRWAGISSSSQPAYIFHSHGNGPPRPSLAPRGGNVPGHGSRGATSCLETMPTLRSSPPQGGSRRCSGRNPWLAASDGWSLQPADRWDAACQPSSCPSQARTLRRTGYIEGRDWSSHQLTATYFARQLRLPLTLGLRQPTFVTLVWK